MTADELDKALKTLRLSQRGAASLMGINERTVRAWLEGRYKVPRYAALILQLFIKHNENPEDWK
jgi:DNA-binding transcriptional regulator YiaG